MRWSRPGETVLDAFVGSGTTAVEAKLLGRKCIGVDVNPAAVELSRQNVAFEPPRDVVEEPPEPILVVGDARDLHWITDESIDLICTHPPYAGIIGYSTGVPGDLSACSDNEYLDAMEAVACEFYRVLKPGRTCAILLGDARRHKHVVPLAMRTIERFLRAGFRLRELVIKRQHNCRATGFWKDRSVKYGFLLLAHEYLPIFEKPGTYDGRPRLRGSSWSPPPLRWKQVEVPRPEDPETTTVWLNATELSLAANLAQRFSKNGTVAVLSTAGAGAPTAEQVALVEQPEGLGSDDVPSWAGWVAGVSASLECAALAVLCRDVRDARGYLRATALELLLAMEQTKDRWALRELIVVVPQHPRAGDRGELTIVHDYLLVFVPRRR